MDNDKLDELERVAREAMTRPEVCTPEYSAMRNAQERFSALMTPSLFLALITAARRPDGWVMVPRELTEAMHEAALDQLGRNPDRPDEEIDRIYRAMLSAAAKEGE